MFLNLIMKSRIFSFFCKWICMNSASKVWYATSTEYRTMKASSLSARHVIELTSKEKYQSYVGPTRVCRKNITITSSSITEWMSQMAKNWCKCFLGFITPSPLQTGKTPIGREEKGCLFLGRANDDALRLHLAFCTAYLLSSFGSIFFIFEKREILTGITCGEMLLSR